MAKVHYFLTQAAKEPVCGAYMDFNSRVKPLGTTLLDKATCLKCLAVMKRIQQAKEKQTYARQTH